MAAFKPIDHKAIAENPRLLSALSRRIQSTYQSADPSQRAAGESWYGRAHDIAHEVGGGDVRRGAGVIAALSPKTEWGLNVAAARQFTGLGAHEVDTLASGGRVEFPQGSPLGRQTGDNLTKAARIHTGEDPASLLPMRKKTGNFFSNIHDPSDPTPVTIDTHAHDIAVGRKLPWETERGLSAVGRYGTFADAYRHAARRLEVATPNQVQAVTWTAWRDQHGRQRDA